MFTVENLKEKLVHNNYDDFTVDMPNGDVLLIQPCSYAQNKNLDNIEYFLVYGSEVQALGGETLEELCNQFNQYDKLISDHIDSVNALKKFYNEKLAHKVMNPRWKSYEDDDFSFYSDWYKSVHGVRPRILRSFCIAYA